MLRDELKYAHKTRKVTSEIETSTRGVNNAVFHIKHRAQTAANKAQVGGGEFKLTGSFCADADVVETWIRKQRAIAMALRIVNLYNHWWLKVRR